MTGTSEKTFEPNLGVTRATIVQTLYKLEGKPAVSDFRKYNSLNDTLDSIWWKNSLAWAIEIGLIKGKTINGVSDLAPQVGATRAELATIMMRFYQNNNF